MKLTRSFYFTAIIAIFFILFAPLFVNGLVSRAFSSSGIIEVSPTPCYSAEEAQYQKIDNQSAIISAKNWSIFRNVSARYENVKFSNVMETENALPPDCIITNLQMNVVFSGENSSGSLNILVAEDPNNLATLGLQIQYAPFTNQSSPTESPTIEYGRNWAGYQINPQLGYVLGSESIFNVTNPKVPSYTCQGAPCVVANWVGLADKLGASDNSLAQDGVYAQCGPNSNCSPTYELWYQLYTTSNHQTNCSTDVHSGDAVTAQVINEGIYSNAGNNPYYDFFIYDGNTGATCIVNGDYYSQLLAPHYGVFIVECQLNWVLSQFGTIHYYDAEIYAGIPGNWQYIYNLNNVNYYENIMHNAPHNIHGCGTNVLNAEPTSIASTNGASFKAQWHSSDNTPPVDNC